jgi:hypothetical protein
MPASDSLEVLARELDGMSPHARRAILRCLTPAEREMFADRASGGSATPERATTDLDRFSPRLAALIEQARDGAAGSHPDGMTSASRQALLRSIDAITGSPRTSVMERGAASRSLLDAVGGLLSPRRARS